MTMPAGDPAAIAAALKAAMRRMPATVALITTRDPDSGEPAGLAASAIIPVSMEPPSMLVSINRSASAHALIARARRFCINLLGVEQTALVALFSDSTMRAHRFAGAQWLHDADLPYLPDACAAIFCTLETSLEVGTHELFVGAVSDIAIAPGNEPLAWFDGGFARLGAFDR